MTFRNWVSLSRRSKPSLRFTGGQSPGYLIFSEARVELLDSLCVKNYSPFGDFPFQGVYPGGALLESGFVPNKNVFGEFKITESSIRTSRLFEYMLTIVRNNNAQINVAAILGSRAICLRPKKINPDGIQFISQLRNNVLRLLGVKDHEMESRVKGGGRKAERGDGRCRSVEGEE